MSFISINIEVSTHIYKYLTALYGDDYVASFRDSLGILILSSLQKQSHIKEYDVKKKELTREYSVHINFSSLEKHGCFISEKQLYKITKSLEYDFRYQIFRTAILNKENFGIDYKKSILKFLESYNIHDSELPYSTLIRDFNRKKHEIEKNLNIR